MTDIKETIRLADLEPVFVKWDTREPTSYIEVSDIKDANGVQFYCPRGGEKACHLLIWTLGVPLSMSPTPGRWTMCGTSLQDLTLYPSVDVSNNSCGCGWHGWVEKGICR